MYEGMTVESIKSDILGRLSSDINASEGSFINDMVSAVAYEIWKSYQALDAIIPIAFVDETSGEYIDKRAGEYGITRKAGTKATATMYFSGTDGTIIPAGKVFLTADGLEYAVVSTVTISGGTATATVEAVDVGEAYNVASGTITLQIISLSGLTAVTNEAAIGGTEPESDSALLGRLQSYLQNPPSSGNVAHYKQWAGEVDGVGGVKIIPLWDGPGTVKVLIVSDSKSPVEPSIVDNCAAHIEANRPIGADVTVLSAEAFDVNIAAEITIESTTTLEIVKEAFENTLAEYLQSIAFDKYTIVYNRIAYMLLDIPGVVDYIELTLNEGIANLVIGENQVPMPGTVVIAYGAY